MNNTAPMTAAERREIAGFTKQYVRGLRARGEHHAAQLVAACETEFARVYDEDDAAWGEFVRDATQATARANEAIREAFRQRGLTNRRRMPEMHSLFIPRGETSNGDRRQELRRVAEAQAKLLIKHAVAQAEAVATDLQQRVLVEQMPLETALAEVRGLPTLEALAPALDPAQVERIARNEDQQLHRYKRLWPELTAGDEDSED